MLALSSHNENPMVNFDYWSTWENSTNSNLMTIYTKNQPVRMLDDASLGKNSSANWTTMADPVLVAMLAINSASPNLAHCTLAQDLSRSFLVFSSFIQEILNQVIKADQCVWYVHDIAVAANDPQQIVKNHKAVLACIQKAWFKTAMEKCHIEVSSHFPWPSHNIAWNSPTVTQNFKISRKSQVFTIKKSTKEIDRFLKFLRKPQNHTSWENSTICPKTKIN